ncbi:hypothetical protein [Methylorubrum extorquens]|uniref:hypothetical protein n=1 Tax=Methylorubrum extorquens TaxID=408 RepID=UPI002238378A|nr:hypothetical protein [Methylorubrum extorquens]UYW26110.1 hypothetical protein OKC48_23025 [Methylorubrum extorquens]UYW34085.1 hypothetical protein OKB92_08395 [Methylorubrum extorquens]
MQWIIPNRNDRENFGAAAKSLSERSFFSQIAAARKNLIPIMCGSTRGLLSVAGAAEEGVSPNGTESLGYSGFTSMRSTGAWANVGPPRFPSGTLNHCRRISGRVVNGKFLLTISMQSS